MEHARWQAGEVSLHVVTAGQGPAVVLLHGFPEFWYSWRKQIPVLAEAGYRAIAPDLRGYDLSDKPGGVAAYAVDRLVADVANLIERQASGEAAVVGHDWGGIVAWRLAALRPELVRKLVILNSPHPKAYERVLRNNWTQWFRSAYVLLFQIPGVAERLIRSHDFYLLDRAFRHQPTNGSAFSDADIARYKEALAQPGALTAALNYYRAALRYSRPIFALPQRIDVPTLVIWGERDPYLSIELTKGLEEWVKNLRMAHLPRASHWVQNDEPETVNRLLIEFLSR